jgi:hypothetical protein
MRRFPKSSSLSLLSIFVLWVQHLTICDRALLLPFVNSLLVFSLNHAVELKKQISCALQLTNKTDEQVAFKVNKHSSKNVPTKRLGERCSSVKMLQGLITSPKKYCVRPNHGIVPPRSTADVLGNLICSIHLLIYLETAAFMLTSYTLVCFSYNASTAGGATRNAMQ